MDYEKAFKLLVKGVFDMHHRKEFYFEGLGYFCANEGTCYLLQDNLEVAEREGTITKEEIKELEALIYKTINEENK